MQHSSAATAASREGGRAWIIVAAGAIALVALAIVLVIRFAGDEGFGPAAPRSSQAPATRAPIGLERDPAPDRDSAATGRPGDRAGLEPEPAAPSGELSGAEIARRIRAQGQPVRRLPEEEAAGAPR